MTSPGSADAVALASLAALEHRLQRLNFYLTGATPEVPQTAQDKIDREKRILNPQARLAELEIQLTQLTEKRPGVTGLLELQSKHPDLFSTSSQLAPRTTGPQPLTLLPPSHLLALTTSLAPEIQTTASRLTSLQELIPLPASDSFATLISILAPQIIRAETRQEEVEGEIKVLRERSAKILEGWVEGGVIGGGKIWAEWEARVSAVEGKVRRREVEKEKEKREV